MKKNKTNIMVQSAIYLIAAVLAFSINVWAEETEFIPKQYEPDYQHASLIPENASNTGSSSYGIPIVVPPGRGGIAVPGLALSYSSGRKNGILGMGWSLDTGSIKRSTKKGLDYSGTDFEMNGSELVLKSTSSSTLTFREKYESGFSYIRYMRSSDKWIVEDGSGVTFYYGSADDSRQLNGNNDVFRWCLDKVVDANGNSMSFDYTKDLGQIYPVKIKYSGDKNSVLFGYESRTDKTVSYESQSEVITALRLNQIITKAGTLVARTYDLTYDASNADGIFGRSRLASVQINDLQPISFDYENGKKVSFKQASGSTAIPVTTGSVPVHYADLNGDGKQDLIQFKPGYSNDRITTYLSDGDGTFSNEEATDLNLGGTGSNVYFTDINHDGLDDMLHYRATGCMITSYLSDGDGTFSEQDDIDLFTQDGCNETRLVISDVDGDGFSDIIKFKMSGSASYAYTYISDGTGAFDFKSKSPTGSVSNVLLNNINFADANGDGFTDIIFYKKGTSSKDKVRVVLCDGEGGFSYDPDNLKETTLDENDVKSYHFADINGDGLSDLVQYKDRGTVTKADIYTYLSHGDGTFGSSKLTIVTYGGYNPIINFADMDGDGFSDMVMYKRSTYSTSDTVYVHRSYGNGSFNDDYDVEIPVYDAREDALIGLADVNGDGITDMVQYAYAYAGDTVYASISTYGAEPDLLTNIQDNLSGGSTISSIYYDTAHHTGVPFLITAINKIELSEPSNALVTTTYTYTNAVYNRKDREFRGFQSVTKVNPDKKTKEISLYHQDDALKGKAYKETLSTLSGTALIDTTNDWKDYTSREDWFFINLEAKTIKKDGDTFNESYDFDPDKGGNIVKLIKQGPEYEAVTTSYSYGNFNGWRLTNLSITGQRTGLARKTVNGYDSKGNLTSVKNYYNSNSGYTTKLGYDSYGNCTSVTDPETNKISITYENQHTLPAKISYSSLISVEYSNYDYTCGGPRSIKGKNGKTTAYTYDDLGRYTAISFPDGGKKTFSYTDSSYPRKVTTKVTVESGGTMDTVESFDGLNRSIRAEISGQSGTIISRNNYDIMGRKYLTYGPYYSGTSSNNQPYARTAFDNLGRPLSVTTPAGVTGYSYDGLETTITDPDDNKRVVTYCHMGFLREVSEGGLVAKYSYNIAGDLESISRGNLTTSITTNLLGWKTAMDDPDMGVWTYKHDRNGNIESQTDAKGNTLKMVYDSLNRLTSKTWLNGSEPAVTYAYDTAINGKSALYSVTKGDTTKTFDEYDTMGRVLEKTVTIAGTDYTFAYEYGKAGEMTKLTYPDNYSVDYTYHAKTGFVKNATGSDGRVFVLNSSYTALGQVKKSTYNNQSSTEYDYDTATGRLERILAEHTPSGTDYLYYDYENYSAAGDIKTKHDHVTGYTYTYKYDSLHRLLSENVAYSPSYNTTHGSMIIDYSYSSTSTPAHAPERLTYTSGNGADGSAYIDYDQNGNTIEMPYYPDPDTILDRELDYNEDNMPVSISLDGDTVASYQYDGEGKRTMKTEGNSITHYVDSIYEVTGITTANSSGNPVKYIFAGSSRIARIDTAGTVYFHKDHLGSSSVISNEAGEIVESSSYMPYGMERDHTGTETVRYKFTDQELDHGTGLYNYDARLYDPVIGMFITPDPLIPNFSDLENGHVFDPQMLNRYAYCRNNPLIYVDPSGLTIELLGNRDEQNNLLGLLSKNVGTELKANDGFVSDKFKSNDEFKSPQDWLRTLIKSEKKFTIQFDEVYREHLTSGIFNWGAVKIDNIYKKDNQTSYYFRSKPNHFWELIGPDHDYKGETVLAHELFGHGLSWENEKGPGSSKGLSRKEKLFWEGKAVERANVVRGILGEPLKHGY